MPNIITLRAIPQIRAAAPTGAQSTIEATVIDSETLSPQPNVAVSFSTDTLYATLTTPVATTNGQGIATTTLIYPNTNPGGLSGAAVIDVVASLATGATTSIFVNYFDRTLRDIVILNATTDTNTGVTPISRQTVINGVLAIVYFPADIQYGDIITFFWGRQSLQMVYVGGPLLWVIDVNASFIPEQTLAQGEYNVWYFIQDAVGNRTGSTLILARIADSPLTLPTLLPPLLPPALNGVINLAAAEAGVAITAPLVAQSDVIHSGDRLTLYLALFTLAGQPLRAAQQIGAVNLLPPPLTNRSLPVPASALLGLNGVFGEFYYQIQTLSSPPAMTLISRSTRAYIDTVPPGES